MSTNDLSVTVLGAGSWGTAFATLLAENGYRVQLWCYESEVAQEINTKRENCRYLPGVALDDIIVATESLEEALAGTQWVFEVIPVKFLRSILKKAQPFVRPEQAWVVLSKGIEQDTHLLPSGIIDDVFSDHTKKATLSGPNFAKDFAEKSYTATTIAATDCDLGEELQRILANSYFRPYLSLDLAGVQVGGAIKNVYALTIGIAKGAGYGDNTVAYLITRGLAEMGTIAAHFGGKQETVFGLSGLGDLILTSLGAAGRNQKVGTMIGQGKTLAEIEAETGIIAEGVNTVQSMHQIMEQSKHDLPICKGTYEIMFEGRDMKSLLDELMARPLVREREG